MGSKAGLVVRTLGLGVAIAALAVIALAPGAAQAESGLTTFTNGATWGPSPTPPGGRGAVVTDGLWLEFSFSTAGVPASGCAPADPNAGICFPSSGGCQRPARARPKGATGSRAGPHGIEPSGDGSVP